MKFVSPRQLDISNPGTWPIYYKILFWVVIVGLAAFLYNKFVREPLVEQQDAHNMKITQLKSEYSELYQYQQDLPKYKERSEELVGVLRSLLDYLPSNDEMPDLIDNVYISGVDNGIIFDTFQPEKDPNKLSVDSQLQTYVYNEDIDKFLKMDLKSLQEHAKKENVDVEK